MQRPPEAQNNLHVVPDRKSTRLNSSHQIISYAVFCLKKKTNEPASAAVSSRTGLPDHLPRKDIELDADIAICPSCKVPLHTTVQTLTAILTFVPPCIR